MATQPTIAREAQRVVTIPLGAVMSARDELERIVAPYEAPATSRRELGRQLRRLERRRRSVQDAAADELRRRRAQAERRVRRGAGGH